MKGNWFTFGNMSHMGLVRTNNEDYFAYAGKDPWELFVVCDGMGGHEGGEKASQTVVSVLVDRFREYPGGDAVSWIRQALEAAHQAVREESRQDPSLQGMGTTCVLILLEKQPKPVAWIANVGDSRAYQIRGGQAAQISEDHSQVAEMVKMGILTEEQAASHPNKNVITQAVGYSEKIKPTIKAIGLYAGDRFVLCTDGVSDLVPISDISLLSKGLTPQEMADKLVSLANERGGHDNSTVQVVDIVKGPKLPASGGVSRKLGPFSRQTIFILSAGIAILALMLLLRPWNLFRGPALQSDSDAAAIAAADTLAGSTNSVPPDSVPHLNPFAIPHQIQAVESLVTRFRGILPGQ